MRIRTVKPEFFRHEGLQDLEIEHPGSYVMLTFCGLWGLCDKNGVFPWKPRTIKLDILPFLPFKMVDTLGLLLGGGYVIRFNADGVEWGYIPTFNDHQRISGKEASSAAKYPEYRGSTREAPGKQPRSEGDTPSEAGDADNSVQSTDKEPNTPGKRPGSAREAPEKHPDAQERKGKGRGREGSGNARTPARDASSKKIENQFDGKSGFTTSPPVAADPPSWPEVADAMAEYYLENQEGQREWLAMCRAAGVATDAVDVNTITAIWAGKQDMGTLRHWQRYTGNLTNWIKNQANDRTAKKSGRGRNDLGAAEETIIAATESAIAEYEKYL